MDSTKKKPNFNYSLVWAKDIKNSDNAKKKVESVNAVMKRTTKFILDLEKKHKKQKIILVSHGDTLQILQTAFAKKPAASHRSRKHLHLGEIRELKLK